MASVEVGETLYHRGEGNESDIWDDSALIKAYDAAVNVMKAKLAAEQGDDEHSTTAQEQSHINKQKKNKKRHRNKKKDKNLAQKTTQWSEGDHCRAVYTDDGQVYASVIVSLNEDAGTCIVKYLDYGNEEEHNLTDLMPSQPPVSPARKRNDSQAEHQSDGESSMDWRGGLSPRPGSVTSSGRSTSQGRGHSHRPPKTMPNSSSQPFMGFMPPPAAAAFPFMPPMFPSMPSFPGWPGMSGLPGSLPQVPPPPPMPEDLPDDDVEALHSMLIAWYMSGYHTGYYQGLKNSRKKTPQSPGSQQKVKDGLSQK